MQMQKKIFLSVPLSVVLIKSIDDGNEIPREFRAYTTSLYNAFISRLVNSISLSVVFTSCNEKHALIRGALKPHYEFNYIFHFHYSFIQSHIIDFAVLHNVINIVSFLWSVYRLIGIFFVWYPLK